MRTLDPRDPAATYAAVFDALPIVAYMARPDGVVSYLSRGWERFTGHRAETILRDGYETVIFPEDVRRVAAAWSAARKAEIAHRDEYRIRFHDGSYHWVVSQAEPVRSDGGTVLGWFGTLADIDDLKQAQAALAESEATYRTISAAIPGVTWAASPAGDLTFVGARWTEVHGKPREGALGESWLEAVHPDDRTRVLGVWAQSLATGDPYDVQFRVRLADGTYHWFLVRALPVRDDANAIVRWVGVNVDIEEQHRADEGREQFVRLVEASDDFIGIGDENGNATYVNEAGRGMLEMGSLEDARRTQLLEYFLPEDRARVENEILPAVLRDGRWIGDFRVRNFRTGASVPVSYNVFSLPGRDGRSAGVATVSRDLRPRLRLEAGLRALADTGGAMFGSLDYEQTLRNVADAATRSFATYCIIDMIAADGRLHLVAAAHRNPEMVEVLARAAAGRSVQGDHPVARAVREGRATLVSDVPPDWVEQSGMNPGSEDDVSALRARSMVCAPIFAADGKQLVGALSCVIDRSDPRGGYTQDDLRFAEEMARRAGIAFDHARAYERERRIAVTLQDASLSKTLPAVDHLHLSAEYRPGNDEATIGGDWYDAFVLRDGRVAVTAGDVLGNGLRAAVTMGKVRQAMRAVATILPEPNAMLDVADETVRGESDDTYATAMAGIFDLVKHEYTFASAGHPGPVLRHPGGRIEEFTAPGVLLGLRTPGTTGTVTVSVPPGTTLVFYTDGLVEATRDIDEGQRRLHAALSDDAVAAAENPARALVEFVLRGRPATDDIAVLVAEVGPSSRFESSPTAQAPDDR